MSGSWKDEVDERVLKMPALRSPKFAKVSRLLQVPRYVVAYIARYFL